MEDILRKNVIALFNLNNKNYFIYLENDNISYAAFSENKYEKICLKSKEIELLDKVYDLIRFNKDYSIYCGKYRINNKIFQIYQDTRSKLYSFIWLDNKKRKVPKISDLVFLNNCFNNKSSLYYRDKTIDKNNKKILILNPIIDLLKKF